MSDENHIAMSQVSQADVVEEKLAHYEQLRMVEAVLFASASPLSLGDLSKRIPDAVNLGETLKELQSQYENRGITLCKIDGNWAFRTASDLGYLLQKETIEQRKLSRAAIETLAIIAYHQPVTRAEIEEIRGVSVSRGTIDHLIDLAWVKLGRRKMTPGRPVTFVVTTEFLDHFGLEGVKDLPGIKELRAAGLLDSRPALAGMPGLNLDGADEEELDEEGQSELF